MNVAHNDTVGGMHNETESAAYPPPRLAWGMVSLLMLAYIFSYLDRAILGLLVEPIKQDLQLSDTQIGLLLGPAFAIFYATMGLPFGWLADRWRRTWLVGLGVAFWSLATFTCGLARNFGQLFVARMCVGVGEATLSPSAMSLIADSFPRERRGKPIAIYSMGIVLGSSAAFLIGAVVLTWARHAGDPQLPLIGAVAPWQLIFIVLGIAGLLPAIPFIFLREPARMKALTQDAALEGSSMKDTLRYVGRHWKTYVSFVSLACLMTIIAYGNGWHAAMFDRSWGWPAERYALLNGILTLPVGLTTYAVAGWLSDRWSQRGDKEAPLKIFFIGAVMMVPPYVAAPLMPNPIAAFVLITIGSIGMGTITAVAVTALLNITPARIRSQIVALYYMTISLTGLFLGPTTVGWLSQNVFGEENLRYAVASIPLLFGVIPIMLIPVTRKLYLRQMKRLESNAS